MGNNDIGTRLEDCFRRQIELFKRMTAADAALPEDVNSSDWERAQRLQAEFSRDLAALEEEFNLLKREWDESAAIDEAVRERMHDLAVMAGEMAGEVARSRAADAERISRMAKATNEKLGTLQRGKRMLRNLRAGESGDGGFIDRQA